jgi:hypothetical protein
MKLKISSKIAGAAVLITVCFLTGCGTASEDSLRQSSTGVSTSGYPAGQPKDAGSPALASSTESKYSRDQAEKEEPSKGSESSNR